MLFFNTATTTALGCVKSLIESYRHHQYYDEWSTPRYNTHTFQVPFLSLPLEVEISRRFLRLRPSSLLNQLHALF